MEREVEREMRGRWRVEREVEREMRGRWRGR